MSKKNLVNVPMSNTDWEMLFKLVQNWNLQNLEGKVLTLLETLGFEQKREEAVKSIFRNELWDWWSKIFSDPKLEQEIRLLVEEYNKKNYPLPPSSK